MNRLPIKSSNIASVGYDPINLILEIEFKSGSIYQYFDVPEIVYQELLRASSAGRYLNRNIAYYYTYKNISNSYRHSHHQYQSSYKNDSSNNPVSQIEIRKIYHKLAHLFHPDHNPNHEGAMKEVNRLYSENDYRELLVFAKRYNVL